MAGAEGGGRVRSSVLRRALPATALVVLVPLVVAPGAATPAAAAKWLTVAVLIPSGLALAASAGPLRWPFARWWGAWLAVLALATATGIAPWSALVGAPGRRFGLIAALLGAGAFVLGASVGGDAAVARRILRAALVTGGIVAAIGVGEALGLPVPGLDDDAERIRSSWGSATFLAGYLVLLLPLAVVHLRAADRRWRRVGLAATATMTIALVLTGTRGAWVGVVAGAVVLAPALPRRGRALPRAAVAGLAGLGLLLAAVALSGPTLDRASGGGRLDLWRTTLPVVADRPVLGAGPDAQRIVLLSGIDDDFEREHGSVELHDRAHDLVLDTAVTTGVLGLVALGGLLASIGRFVGHRLGDQAIARALAAGLVAYLVHLLFAFGEATLDPLAWLLAGILVAALADDAPTPAEARADRPPIAVPLALGALALALGAWALGDLLADHRLASAVERDAAGDRLGALDDLASARRLAPTRADLPQAEARVRERLILGGSPTSGRLDPRNGPGGVDRLLDQGLASIDDALALAPGDPDLLMDRAALLDAAGRHEEALAAFEAVLDGPYPSSSRAWLGIGTAQVALGRTDEAVAAWERAADLTGDDVRALVNLGTLHRSLGRTDEAIAAYRRALERDPDEPTAIAALEALGVAVDAGG